MSRAEGLGSGNLVGERDGGMMGEKGQQEQLTRVYGPQKEPDCLQGNTVATPGWSISHMQRSVWCRGTSHGEYMWETGTETQARKSTLESSVLVHQRMREM